jgi:hypothetical protein
MDIKAENKADGGQILGFHLGVLKETQDPSRPDMTVVTSGSPALMKRKAIHVVETVILPDLRGMRK